MIYQTYDMSVVNSILQRPEIWEQISDLPLFDVPYDPSCMYFLMDGGVIIFHPYSDGLKIHPNVLPEKRGKNAYKAVEESIREMFDRGYKSIYCEIPVELKHVIRFAKTLGFRLLMTGERKVFVRRKLDS